MDEPLLVQAGDQNRQRAGQRSGYGVRATDDLGQRSSMLDLRRDQVGVSWPAPPAAVGDGQRSGDRQPGGFECQRGAKCPVGARASENIPKPGAPPSVVQPAQHQARLAGSRRWYAGEGDVARVLEMPGGIFQPGFGISQYLAPPGGGMIHPRGPYQRADAFAA